MVAEVVRAGRLPGFQITHTNRTVCSALPANRMKHETNSIDNGLDNRPDKAKGKENQKKTLSCGSCFLKYFHYNITNSRGVLFLSSFF